VVQESSETLRARRRRRSDRAESNTQTVEPDPKASQPFWYVIHTYSGYENKVKKNLEQRVSTLDMADKIFEIVVPTEEEIEIRNGQRHTVQRKVFPGYVLVKMIMSDDSWYVVRNTPGVTSFVGMGNKPTPLGDPEVQAIIKQMAAEAPKVKVTLAVGQAVRIIDGPFADFQGVIDEINQEKGKVKVLVSFFGRETPVELDFLQVEKLMK
jgi:transcriptional antiterminator NusG